MNTNAPLPELIPGDPGVPLFPTPEAYDEFREGFCDYMYSLKDEFERRLRLSAHYSRFRLVD